MSVPVHRRQAELLVQAHIVENQHLLLPLARAHATAYLLQVLGQRQGWTGQQDELHLGTVKPFGENVYVHQHVYRLSAVIRHCPLPIRCRGFRVNHGAAHAVCAVMCLACSRSMAYTMPFLPQAKLR